MTDFNIREAGKTDFAALGGVMFEAVREGGSPYSAAQRKAWMPSPRSGDVWENRLGAQHVFLAETDGAAIGFMSLAPMDDPEAGYVDFAYIIVAARGQGLFRQLYEKIAAKAKANGHISLFTHASLLAAPAFAAMGFDYLEKEVVDIGGQSLPRFHMHKSI